MLNLKRLKNSIILGFAIFCLACTPERYRIQGDDGGQVFLIEYIGLKVEHQVLGFKPMVIVDGKVYRHNVELKEESFQFLRSDIASITAIPKAKAIEKYGGDAKDGIVLIHLKSD